MKEGGRKRKQKVYREGIQRGDECRSRVQKNGEGEMEVVERINN